MVGNTTQSKLIPEHVRTAAQGYVDFLSIKWIGIVARQSRISGDYLSKLLQTIN